MRTAGYSYKHISGTGAGTTVIADRPCNFIRIVSGANKTGTVSFYDVATAAGSTATNLIQTIDNTTGTAPQNVEIEAQTKAGLVAVKGGTTDMLVIYE